MENSLLPNKYANMNKIEEYFSSPSVVPVLKKKKIDSYKVLKTND